VSATIRSLGIDLAAQPKNTAWCSIEWHANHAVVVDLQAGGDDAALLSEMNRATWVGIDAPFGWPRDFVTAVSSYAELDVWPAPPEDPKRISHRGTDRVVYDLLREQTGKGLWPLSVSADRIAICAWRCANLLATYAEQSGWRLDRTGATGVAEVYPAAALALWPIGRVVEPHRGYKISGTAAQKQMALKKREAIVAALGALTGDWLDISSHIAAACVANDDCLDALISAIVVGAVAAGRTLPPAPIQSADAALEGWIHVPAADALEGLPAAVGGA
jgi:predicted nuclease with RNAse H fold